MTVRARVRISVRGRVRIRVRVRVRVRVSAWVSVRDRVWVWVWVLVLVLVLVFDSEMASKKIPQALHRSLQLIEQERVNVKIRTQQRIAQLFADELNEAEEANTVDSNDKPKDKVKQVLWHCYLNTFCFCVWLGIMNLLFLQWVYIKVNVN